MGQYLSDTITPTTTAILRNVQGGTAVKGNLWIWETAGVAGSVVANTRDGSVTIPIPANGFRYVEFDIEVVSFSFSGNGASFTVDFGSGYRISPPTSFSSTGSLHIVAV